MTPFNLGGKGVEIENRSDFASLVIEIDLKKGLIFFRFLLLKHFKILKVAKNAPIGFKLGRLTNFGSEIRICNQIWAMMFLEKVIRFRETYGFFRKKGQSFQDRSYRDMKDVITLFR